MKARKIELKSMPVEGGPEITYRDLLQVVITSSGQGGISTDDVLKAVEVKQELKAANGALHLSEPDFNWLLGRLNSTVRWTVANEQLAEFIKDVRGAPLIELEVPK